MSNIDSLLCHERNRRNIGNLALPYHLLGSVADNIERTLDASDRFTPEELKMETWDLQPLILLQEKLKKVCDERTEKIFALEIQRDEIEERARKLGKEITEVRNQYQTTLEKLQVDAVKGTVDGIMEVIKEIPTVKASVEKRKRTEERGQEYASKRRKLREDTEALDKEYTDVRSTGV